MSNLYFDEGEKAVGQKVLLATTAYDSTSPGYVFSIQKSRQVLEKSGIQTAYLLLSGNCHVDDARNSVVQHFLLSDCTDLVFLDADVCWGTNELLALCQSDKDLVGGIYPYRREGKSNQLPVILVPDEKVEDDHVQVAGLPTGFMKIKRHVIETLCKDADHFSSKAEPRSRIPILFERTYENGARWGGDITFCRKWHKAGGKMYAIPDLRLGHTGTATIYDSLSGAMRRYDDQTLNHVVEQIKANKFDLNLAAELYKAAGNPYSAQEDVIMMCSLLARQADKPILETGSGITSIILAASTNQTVYSLEHDDYWADKTEAMTKQVGLENLKVVRCDIENEWYANYSIPDEFFLALNDGPPRKLGSRLPFFDKIKADNVIVDDANDVSYANFLKEWCEANNKTLDFIERSALIREKECLKKSA